MKVGFVFSAALAFVFACGGNPLDPPPSSTDGGTTHPDATAIDRDAEPSDLDSPATLARIEASIAGGTQLLRAQTATLTASGVLTNGDRVDLTRSASWFTSSSSTVRVLAGGRLIAEGNGRAEVWASRGEIESNRLAIEVGTPAPQGELRGVWVTRWTYSNAGDIQRIVDDLAGANFNAIFLQVRGNGDAYYRSTHEPWAKRLSGTLGQDPGWDPLGEMITRAHARGIQVHAWLNTFPAWSGMEPPTESTVRHPLLAHPEWLCADANGTPMPPAMDNYQFFSPGNPDVRAHVANVALEIAANYAVDGLHFDYVRYPGTNYCHDSVSESEFIAAQAQRPDLTWAEFQRSRVTMLLQDVRGRLMNIRPSAIVTVAAWPIYRNIWGWSAVSKGYDDYYQDAHGWIRNGVVDAICPMTYWAMTEPKGLRTDWLTLIEDHIAAANDGARYAYTGISGQHDETELLQQIDLARARGARGLMFFDLSYLRANGHLPRLAAGPFAEPAQVPTYPWR